jgi:phospholipid/cholesterol/gamma-HCH transport system permease protein
MLRAAKEFLIGVGDFTLFCCEIFRETIKPPLRFQQILLQIQSIGIQSINIILITGGFTGAVFGLQIGGIFRIFKAETLMGGATGIALTTELAPLVTGFILAGRVGSAITAEIATMKSNEQIEALEAMGISPVNYLSVPRIIASLIAMPFMCAIFMFIGMLGAYITGIIIFDIDKGIFIEKTLYLLQTENIITGLRKMFTFAFIISATSCYYGIRSSGGSKGVGEATTKAVVKILIGILVSDLIISYLEVRWLA